MEEVDDEEEEHRLLQEEINRFEEEDEDESRYGTGCPGSTSACVSVAAAELPGPSELPASIHAGLQPLSAFLNKSSSGQTSANDDLIKVMRSALRPTPSAPSSSSFNRFGKGGEDSRRGYGRSTDAGTAATPYSPSEAANATVLLWRAICRASAIAYAGAPVREGRYVSRRDYIRQPALPADVVSGIVALCEAVLESRPGEGCAPAHPTLRLLARMLYEATGAGSATLVLSSQQSQKLARSLAAAARSSEARKPAGTPPVQDDSAVTSTLRTHSLVLLCLARLCDAEQQQGTAGSEASAATQSKKSKSASKASKSASAAASKSSALDPVSSDVGDALLIAARSLSNAFVRRSGASGGGGPSKTPGQLRDALTLMQSMPHVCGEFRDSLESSALSLLTSLQPCALAGAPYIVRGNPTVPAVGGSRLNSAALGSESKCGDPLYGSETEWSGADVSSGSGADSSIGGRSRRSDINPPDAVVLAARCRAAAHRVSAALFRLWPKAFFGRWPLVLDFQFGEPVRAASGLASIAAAGLRGKPLQLPLLLTICREDPNPQVRNAALTALCALLEAPGVRSWPVPLERSMEPVLPSQSRSGAGGGGGTAFTPFAGQVAATLRQSHGVVIAMLASSRSGDSQAALKACVQLVSCTPYTKLRPGLLAEVLSNVAQLLQGASSLPTIEQIPPKVATSIAVFSAAFKRADCAEELARCVYGCSPEVKASTASAPPGLAAGKSAPPPPPGLGIASSRALADDLFKHAIHLVSLLSSRRDSFRRDRFPSKDEAPEPPAVSDYMAFVGRMVHIRPAVLPASTRELFQCLIDRLLDQPSASLRTRARRMIEDFVRRAPATDAEGSSAAPAGETAIDADPEWCAEIAHRMLAGLPNESANVVRSAALAALPGLYAAAAQGPGGSAAAVGLKPHALAAIRTSAADSSASVRTVAIQTCGAMASRWFDDSRDVDPATRGYSAFELVLSLTDDAALDVRSAALTAIASFVGAGGHATKDTPESTGGDAETGPCGIESWFHDELGTSLLLKAGEHTLRGSRDRSDKVRSSGFRAIGYVFEALDLRECLGGEPATEDRTQAAVMVERPPGLGDGPGFEPDPGDPSTDAGLPLLLRMAWALSSGVRKPPPKCQWNAARSLGQVYSNRTLTELPSLTLSRLHEILLDALNEAVATSENLKVRIQSTQSLVSVPRGVAVEILWSQKHSDAVIRAFCDALDMTERTLNAEEPPDKQTAAYIHNLRVELRKLGEHWAMCGTCPLGSQAMERLADSAQEVGRLIQEDRQAAPVDIKIDNGSIDSSGAAPCEECVPCDKANPSRLYAFLVEHQLVDSSQGK